MRQVSSSALCVPHHFRWPPQSTPASLLRSFSTAGRFILYSSHPPYLGVLLDSTFFCCSPLLFLVFFFWFSGTVEGDRFLPHRPPGSARSLLPSQRFSFSSLFFSRARATLGTHRRAFRRREFHQSSVMEMNSSCPRLSLSLSLSLSNLKRCGSSWNGALVPVVPTPNRLRSPSFFSVPWQRRPHPWP